MTENPRVSDDDEIAWGAKAISEVINRPERATWHLLQKNVPARKIGDQWAARKGDLRNFFRVTEAAA